MKQTMKPARVHGALVVAARLGATLALAACAGPKPAPPADSAVTAPAAWRDDATMADATSQVALPRRWWSSFGDPVLTATVARALAHNTDIASAAARVMETRAQLNLSEAQQGPNVVAELDGARQSGVSAFGKQLVQNPRQVQLSISYDADLFGRLAHLSQAARLTVLASVAARHTVTLAVATSAASGYIGLRALDARLLLLQQSLAARADALHVARRRAERGYSPMLELHQAQAEYQATAQLIPAAELAIRRQEDALSVLLGEHPRAAERGVALAVLRLPSVPTGLPSALLRRRPDIVQAEQLLAAADVSLDAARDAFMPTVRLAASGGYADSDVLANPVKLFLLGGSVLAPLFDSGRLQAQADGAAARRDQAAYAYRKAALNAFREVEDALAGCRRNGEQEQALEAQRDALGKLLRIASQRYRAGYAAYLEQVDAQRSLLAVELNLVQARSDRLVAVLALYQSVGGSWQGEADGNADVRERR